MAEDDRFRSNGDRVTNREELFPILNDLFAAKTTEDWVKVFDGSGMPYAPINTMEMVFDHPQTQARNMITEVELKSARAGKIKLLGMAMFPLCRQVYLLMSYQGLQSSSAKPKRLFEVNRLFTARIRTRYWEVSESQLMSWTRWRKRV